MSFPGILSRLGVVRVRQRDQSVRRRASAWAARWRTAARYLGDLPSAVTARLVAGRRYGGWQRYVVTPEERSEEVGDHAGSASLIELVAAEAVDLVAG